MGAAAAKAAAAAEKLATRKLSKPRSATEFERGARTLRGKTADLKEFVASVTPAELPKVMRESLSTTMLSAYVEAFKDGYLPAGDGAGLAAMAEALSKLPRFDFNVMLLSKGDKAAMAEVFAALDKAGGGSVAQIRKAWKV